MSTRPGDLSLEIEKAGEQVHLLPGPAADVGEDLAACMVTTGLARDYRPALQIDVGTNGKITANVGDRLVGCATSAGAAREGAGMRSGTRAIHGAYGFERIPSRRNVGCSLWQTSRSAYASSPMAIATHMNPATNGRFAAVLSPRGRASGSARFSRVTLIR